MAKGRILIKTTKAQFTENLYFNNLLFRSMIIVPP